MSYVDYKQYIQSEEWQEKRAQRLEFANHRCELCNCPDNLHVHHRSYDNLGDEPIGDLVVLCEECHDVFHDRLALHTESDDPKGECELVADLIDQYVGGYQYLCCRFIEGDVEAPPESVIREMAMLAVEVAVEASDPSLEIPCWILDPSHPESMIEQFIESYQYLSSQFARGDIEPPPPSGIAEMALVAVIESNPSLEFPDWMLDPSHPDSLI